MKKKRLLAAVLSGVMAVSLAACSGGQSGESAQQAETQAAETQAAEEGSSAAEETAQAEAASGEAVEMWFALRENESTLPEGSMDILKESVKEKFNVDLRIDRIDQSSYEEKLNVMIASGEFPDIIDSNGVLRLGEAVDGGLLIPMDDFIASDPVWSTANPEIFQKFSYQGQTYGLPVVMDKADGIYYRTDWLKKLGLSLPTNADELYDVLLAFATQDPDGNGQDDTYGLTMASTFDQSAPIWQLFLPANPIFDLGFYIDKDTGKADNVFNHKEDMQAALAFFKKMYDNGVLDREFVLNTTEEAENKFITGKSGGWVKGVLWIEPRQAKLEAANPDGDMLCFPTLQGTYGANLKCQPSGRALYLTRAASDHLELAKQVLGYISSPDGIKDLYLGKEGVTYTIDGDKIAWTNPDDASKYNPGNLLSCPFGIDLPVPSPHLEANLEVTADYELSPLIQVTESATYNANGADMKKVVLEGITKIIIGEQPEDYLDTIIADLESLGMNEVCEELNAG